MTQDKLVRVSRAMALGAVLVATNVIGQTYPVKPVSLVFPWPPGGADAVPRALAERMSDNLGQPVVFENRPGAGGTVGLATVARAAPDGYSLAITDITSHAISGSLYKKLSYDVVKDFSPIAMAARTPLALAVTPALGIKTYPEFVAQAKSQPGKFNFASSGNGAITHLAVERLKRMANLDLLHVPFNGSAPAVASLLSGTSTAAFATVPSVLANARAGKLVLLGTTFPKSLAQLSDLPPISQYLPGFDMGLYQGVLAPSGVPRAVVERLHLAVDRALNDPKVNDIMQRAVFEPARMTPEQFRNFLEAEAKSWGELVRALNLAVD